MMAEGLAGPPATANRPPLCYTFPLCPSPPGIVITIQSTCGGRSPDFTHTEVRKDARRGEPSGPGGFFVARMDLDFSKFDGLIPAVVQDHRTGRVLMVGYMNAEAFRRTVDTGFATFYSRSRQKLWLKGETSGHRLAVQEISTDCDQDCLLVRVEPQGPGVCHNGYESCFYRRLENGQWTESEPRAYDPATVYGNQA